MAALAGQAAMALPPRGQRMCCVLVVRQAGQKADAGAQRLAHSTHTRVVCNRRSNSACLGATGRSSPPRPFPPAFTTRSWSSARLPTTRCSGTWGAPHRAQALWGSCVTGGGRCIPAPAPEPLVEQTTSPAAHCSTCSPTCVLGPAKLGPRPLRPAPLSRHACFTCTYQARLQSPHPHSLARACSVLHPPTCEDVVASVDPPGHSGPRLHPLITLGGKLDVLDRMLLRLRAEGRKVRAAWPGAPRHRCAHTRGRRLCGLLPTESHLGPGGGDLATLTL